MSRGRVLITDCETRGVLAAARGLADAGFEVAAARSSGARSAAAHWSRSVAERLSLPDPVSDEAGFVAALEQVVSRGHFRVLLPGSDASLLDISHGRERLESQVRIGLPPSESVRRCLDKTDLAVAAAHHELDPPPTTLCRSSAEAIELARQLGFPVMVKPLSSVVGNVSRRRMSSALLTDADALAQAVADFGGSALIQEYVTGSVVSFAGVFADARLLGEAVSRYHRTWPPRAGNVCYSETIAPREALRARVVALLRELGWEGLFELELIERGDASWYAIDLNPRPYGSLALAIGAGANLPAIWCEHLLGSSPQAVTASPGVFYRWMDADLRHGLWQLRNGNGTRSRAGGVLSTHRGVVHPYFRGADPGPGVARLVEVGRRTAEHARPARRPA